VPASVKKGRAFEPEGVLAGLIFMRKSRFNWLICLLALAAAAAAADAAIAPDVRHRAHWRVTCGHWV
jgi:hypothetical protein